MNCNRNSVSCLGMLAILLTLGWTVPPSVLAQDDQTRQQESSADKPNQDDTEEGTESVLDILNRAVVHARAGEFDDAIAVVEEALEQDDQNINSLFLMVRLLGARADEVAEDDSAAAHPYVLRAAKIVRQISKLAGINPRTRSQLAAYIYEEARSLAATGKPELAIQSLTECFEWGFDDVDLAASDESFAGIANTDAFKKMIKRQRELIAKRMADEAAAEMAAFQSYDFDFQLIDVNGNEVSLEDYRGKILIANFWGTWCGPCRAEIPSFIKLKEVFADEDLDVVGLTYEHGEDDEQITQRIQEFMEDFEVNYNCLIGDEETMEMVAEFRGFPTTLFVDRNGDVRLQLVGLHPYAKLEAVVKQLLDGSEPSHQHN